MSRLALLARLLGLFDQREKWRLTTVAVMMALGAGLELLGIGAIVPFIGILGNPQLIEENRWLARARDWSGADTAHGFLLVLGVVLLVLFVVKNVYLAALAYVQHKFAQDKQAALSKALFDAYMRNPYTFHLQHNTAILMRNVNGEAQSLVAGVVMPSLVLLNELLVFSLVVLMLIAVEPYVAISAMVIVGGIALVSQHLVKPVLAAYGRNRASEGGEMNKWVSQGLASVKESKVLGREEYFVDAHHAATLRYARSTLYFEVLNAVPRLIIETLAVGGMLVVVVAMLARGADLTRTLPVLALFAVATIRLIPSITRMFAAISSIRFYYPTVETVTRGLAAAQAPGRRAEALQQRAAPVRLQRQIDVDGVWFRYPESGESALAGASFSIPKGSSVALVGPSGAGKSTLVDILLGLLEPQRGAIRVDGVDLQGMIPGWQSSIGYVPQAIYLLDDTIRRNVAFGIADDEIEDTQVWRALRAASLEEKARSLPGGLDTPVGERGARLSGGERQRLGIARALYHDPEVIVFDEATSSLDATTEQGISRALTALAGAKTVVIIAHRLSTVQHCDQLIFMKHGTVGAIGSFSSLVQGSPEFADLVRNQHLFMPSEIG